MTTSYRFGRVEVRPAERQIVIEGQAASVGARAFDVLMALIDRRDRVVTKDELLDIVWPGLVVEENNLQVQVSTLRKVLGARSVATIPGRGYRFTLEPETPEAATSAPSAPRHNLPASLNRFIGREHEILEVKGLLAGSRLVTLASLGGTGKTRLSLQVAHELVDQFPDGVWLVELAPLSDEARVPQAVASVLGIVEEPGSTIMQALCARLRDRNLLLVLDNCEHVLKAVADLAKQLLQAAPSLHMLASSREALRIAGETLYPLAPLPTPDLRYATSGNIVQQYDAVQLFVDRARAANGNFQLNDENVAAVADICRRLDGIPLAIELASARVRGLSVENIASRLDNCFRLLTGGDQTAAPRQQTLRASLDWSHDLLETHEAELFRRLAVFAGGWTLDAAEGVCLGGSVARKDVLDLLSRLVEKSLVEIDAYGERYRLLQTVKQYASEKLEASGQARDVRARHVDYYLSLAEGARPHLVGADQAGWLMRLDEELDNLVAAHRSAGGELGLRLASSMKFYCINRGMAALAHRLLSESLERAPEPTATRCKALFDAGQAAYVLGRHDDARRWLEESIALARSFGDTRRIAAALQPLGQTCAAQGDFASARRHLDAALQMARESGHDREIAAALNALALLHRLEGDLRSAAKLYEEAIACARRVEDGESVAIALLNLSMVSIATPAGERAAMLLEALRLGDQVGSRYVGQSVLEVTAGLAALVEQWAACARFFGAAEAQAAHAGVRRDAADEAFLAPLMDAARTALTPAEFTAMQKAGATLPYERALCMARDWLKDVASNPRS